MNKKQTIATMHDVFSHRIDGDPTESKGWLIWESSTSTQTMAKFVARAKDEGVKGVFCRPGHGGKGSVVGCRNPE